LGSTSDGAVVDLTEAEVALFSATKVIVFVLMQELVAKVFLRALGFPELEYQNN